MGFCGKMERKEDPAGRGGRWGGANPSMMVMCEFGEAENVASEAFPLGVCLW